MPRIIRFSIRSKITLPATLLAIVPIIGLLWIGNWRLQKAVDFNITSIAENRFAAMNNNILQLQKSNLAIASIMANLPETKRGYEAYHSDSILLNESALILENSIVKVRDKMERDAGQLLRVHFHLPQSISFYRSWADLKGDDLSKIRNSPTIVARTRKPVAGFEIGYYGVFLRGTVPVLSNDLNTFYGTVETMVDVEQVLKKAVASKTDNFAVFIQNSRLAKVNKQLLAESFLERIGSFSFVSYSSNEFRLSNLSAEALSEAFSQRKGFSSFFTEQYFYAGQPINDVSGQKIGVIIFQYDIAAFTEQIFLIRMFSVVTAFLLVLFIILAMALVARWVSLPIERLYKEVTKMSKGVVIDPITNLPPDEFGLIGDAMNLLVMRVKRLITFSEKISEGIYSSEFVVLNVNDALGKSLVMMQNKLKEVELASKSREAEDQRNNWLAEGRAKVGEILRENIDNLDSLSDKLINFIIKYIGANQGGLFIAEENDAGVNMLRMTTAYAYNRKKFLLREFKIGSGLVGMCAFEREIVYLRELPEDYIVIQSGLGGANPTVLLLLPLVFNDQLFGVIELASFNEIDDYKISFLELMTETIASSLSTVKINARTNFLLKKYQDQSVSMEEQENLMRNNLEEASRRERDARLDLQMQIAFIENLDRNVLRMVINPTGNVIELNESLRHICNCDATEWNGLHFMELFNREERNKIFQIWSSFIESEDETTPFLSRINVPGGVLWVMGRLSRIFDPKKNEEQYIYLGVDVNSLKKEQVISSNKLGAIQTSLLYSEFDIEGNFTSKADLFIKGLGFQREALSNKKLLDFTLDVNVSEYKQFWLRLKLGYSVVRIEKYMSYFNNMKWFHSTYVPCFDENGEIDRVLQIATDVTNFKQEVAKLERVEKKLVEQVDLVKDLDLELNLTQSRLLKLKKEFDFYQEEQALKLGKEKIDFEYQKEDLRKEVVELHIKVEQLELERNIQRINYEKQIASISRIFDEDRKKLNKQISALELDIKKMKGWHNANF